MNCNLDLRKVVDLIIKDLLVFKTAVKYYNNHGSKVFVAALDLTKTCDRLNQSITILKLYYIGVPRDIVMTFVFWFQHFCLEWFLFSMFNTKSSVRQGGVCSGWLFNLCTNELISKFEDSGLECRLGLHGIL